MTTIAGADAEQDLASVVAEVAHLLPAQGPISIFIHHNPLHAFEHLAFEEAVVEAGKRFGCEPYLSEERYRREIGRGRIAEEDVRVVLASRLGARGAESVAGVVSRADLRLRIAVHGIPAAPGAALGWLLHEMDLLDRFRRDLPPDARDGFAAIRGPDAADGAEAVQVRLLWEACREAVARAGRPAPPRAPRAPVRHRDLLLAGAGVDTDEWIHPVLVRFCGAAIDQGLARWRMPLAEGGMYESFVELHGDRLVRCEGAWARELPALAADDRRHRRDAMASLAASLEALGVPGDEHRDFLEATALALRGWAGMVRQIEERPDRVPAHAAPARLADYLAVRLLLERAALAHAARACVRPAPALRDLRARLRERLPASPPPARDQRAWALFHVAQLCGLDGARIDALAPARVAEIEAELAEFDAIARRSVLHEAYELHFRHRVYDALAQHEPPGPLESPAFQVVCCIDEREESFRRHLEEVEQAAETFGTAGFFGVAMYYQGETDAHARPLCPVAIRPEHYVEERGRRPDRREALRRRVAGLLAHNIHHTSRTLLGGLASTVLGAFALVPLVVHVLFPWNRHRARRTRRAAGRAAPGRLALDRRDGPPPAGTHAGFTVQEMAAIVRGLLESVGLSGRLSPLVLVVGHGSVSLNNPHESAHDCGACGGGRGGPNARAFAAMANDPRVRRELAAQGIAIDESCWFVGAEHNSCNSAIDYDDLDLLPPDHRPLFTRAARAIEAARTNEAHERCRRFDSAPARGSPQAALRHVEARASDLAQPRPEYGHATNALCIIGRRERTRGLFLDRRAFLVSYDPALDAGGGVLARVLAAVVPVVAGISLEYYFGFVDPAGYGSGTKLPHNITSLLGIMDGALSDLRPGLPWQMVEIHEPMRLAIVVECDRRVLRRVIDADAALRRLVRNRWVFVAALDPGTSSLWELDADADRRYRPEHPLPSIAGRSIHWYRGKRGHLAFAALGGAAAREAHP